MIDLNVEYIQKTLTEKGYTTEEIDNLNLENMPCITLPNQETEAISTTDIIKNISKFHYDNHYTNFIKCPYRGHTVITLKNNKISNYFLNSCNTKVSDKIIKFAICARINSFFTWQHYRLKNEKIDNNSLCKKCQK